MSHMTAALVTMAGILCGQPLYPLSRGRTLSSITQSKGNVVGRVVDNREQGLANTTIIIEGERIRHEVVTDEQGNYEAELPAGIYRIKVKAPSDYPPPRFSRRAAFLVLPNTVVMVNINSFTGYDYCSPKGERVTSLRITEGKTMEVGTLPAPKYDSFSPVHYSGAPLDLVVEYCKKRQYKDYIIYQSAVVSYDKLMIYADNVQLNRKTFQLDATGNEITVDDGKERVIARQVKVRFGAESPIIALVKGVITEASGSGAFNAGINTFNMNINRKGPINFIYEDRQRGIKLVSNTTDFFEVASDARSIIKFGGSGAVTSSKPLPFMINGVRTVEFMVTVRDGSSLGKGIDTFSIEIRDLNSYRRSGILSSGNIKVHRDY